MDWFPRMRAMSLVSSDGDGEQNEIRNLQEKLESTMKLVSNLSGQLTELKEQVGLAELLSELAVQQRTFFFSPPPVDTRGTNIPPRVIWEEFTSLINDV